MLDQLREHLQKTGLIPTGSRVLVGYSGGADSTCLLQLLHLLDVDIVAAHLHHSQRDEADAELEACEAFARSLGVEFISGKADIPAMSADLRIGLEEAGREARYAFFERAAAHFSCSLIATAHTRTDHVETILHHLVRGTGMAGLSGIPERRGDIVRPLLAFEREETREYCRENGLWFHDDPSNEDLSFARARIRHRVLPELRSINPGAVEAVARMAAIVSAEDRYLNGAAAAALETAEKPGNTELAFLTKDCEVQLDRRIVASLPEVLFRRAMRLAVEYLGGQLDSHQTQSLVHGFSTTDKGSVTAIGGTVVIEWTDDRMTLREVKTPAPFRHSLELPGEVESEEMNWRLVAFEGTPSARTLSRASLDAELDSAAIQGNLYFRSVKASDEMQPLGFAHRRKLSDLLSEARLSLSARGRLPLVCDLLGPLWAPGVCLSERVKKVETTRRVTVLRFEPITSLPGHNVETHRIGRA
ncbi:MAG TPA: tRNA lysidine(34) synthetase TilS [Fimbriimonas sp.]|nr:tRNA lysidine(34) synthetase TilS [Fimbriimonas sp.]